METISRAELIKLGGAPDARFAIFHGNGQLYACTSAPEAEGDDDYWRFRGFILKRVIPSLQ